jgi:ferredoxin-NADP reductase
MENLKLALTEIVTHCCDVKTFRFELKKEVAFKPGQYLILTLNIAGKDVSKAFSISSSPTEKGFIQFTKKLSSSYFSNALDNLTIGEEYSIRFPTGRFIFDGQFPKAAFLSGGIGITPIRSIFKYAVDKQLSNSLVLLYSGRTPEYLIFMDEFSIMQSKDKNLKVVYTLTDCNDKVAGCRAGHIDDEMVKQEIPDHMERVFFICGPPGMVDGMRAMLLDKLSIPAGQVITEDFLGY